jgi:hypothetical protein
MASAAGVRDVSKVEMHGVEQWLHRTLATSVQ